MFDELCVIDNVSVSVRMTICSVFGLVLINYILCPCQPELVNMVNKHTVLFIHYQLYWAQTSHCPITCIMVSTIAEGMAIQYLLNVFVCTRTYLYFSFLLFVLFFLYNFSAPYYTCCTFTNFWKRIVMFYWWINIVSNQKKTWAPSNNQTYVKDYMNHPS